MTVRIDLNYSLNPECKKRCNREERKKVTENDLCIEANSVIDELPIRCVGEWGMQKIYLLLQYLGIFATGMKNKWKLNYIEICSGPGRCIDRKGGMEFDGTATSIVKHKSFQYLEKALFFDFNNEVVNTLNKRLSNLQIDNSKAKAILGDYTLPEKLCQTIKNEIDPYSLNLCFIDPTDCSVPFQLIQEIKKVTPNVDFIINLASGTDFNRNIERAFLSDIASLQLKYSKFLGSSDFFRDDLNLKYAKERKHMELRNKFRECYTESMSKLGYEFFAFEQIKHYYDILFASSNKKGIDFWNKATNINFDGQKKMF